MTFRRKRSVTISVLLLLFVFCSSAYAYNGNTGDATPSPTMVAVYNAQTWSNGECVFDLTQSRWDYIPSTATIGAVQLQWTMFPSTGYSGAHVALINSDLSEGYYLPNNQMVTNAFDGQTVRQVFKCKFWVEQKQYPGQALYCIPKLCVYYNL